MKKILLVDNHDSFVYNVAQLLEESAFNPAYDTVMNDCIDFNTLDTYGGIILSPGPGLPEEAGDLCKLISTCLATHPLLGICLGHQAIASTFGAGVIQLQAPLHGHATLLRLTDRQDRLLKGLEPPVRVGRYHSWVVDPASLPECLIPSSYDEDGLLMSFYHASLPIHGVQFHPESFISSCGRIIMDNWLSLCP